MNKEKLLQILTELQKQINSFDGEIRENFLRKTIGGEPAIVHDLQAAIIKIMMATK
jgi:hypothetical protein